MRMRTYRDECQAGMFDAPKLAGATVMVAENMPEAADEYSIFQPNDVLPDLWVYMMIQSQHGPIPSDEWLHEMCHEHGFSLVTPCSGMAALVFDEDVWCPSIYRRTVLFNANDTGATPEEVNKKLFWALANPKTQYAVGAAFAASEALSGSTQGKIKSIKTSQEMGEAVVGLGENVTKAAIEISNKVTKAITPSPESFWNWKTLLVSGALAVGVGYLGIKYGVPAWRRIRGSAL